MKIDARLVKQSVGMIVGGVIFACCLVYTRFFMQVWPWELAMA